MRTDLANTIQTLTVANEPMACSRLISMDQAGVCSLRHVHTPFNCTWLVLGCNRGTSCIYFTSIAHCRCSGWCGRARWRGRRIVTFSSTEHERTVNPTRSVPYRHEQCCTCQKGDGQPANHHRALCKRVLRVVQPTQDLLPELGAVTGHGLLKSCKQHTHRLEGINWCTYGARSVLSNTVLESSRPATRSSKIRWSSLVKPPCCSTE